MVSPLKNCPRYQTHKTQWGFNTFCCAFPCGNARPDRTQFYCMPHTQSLQVVAIIYGLVAYGIYEQSGARIITSIITTSSSATFILQRKIKFLLLQCFID